MCGRVTRLRIALALAIGMAAASASAAPPARGVAFVFCAPGSPGTTEEAQGAMDAFAAAVAAEAQLPGLQATYAASEEAGVARLRQADAAVALVSLPFFLKHEKELGLRAAGLQAVVAGGSGLERWSLVARRGRVDAPAKLEAFTILSTAGYAPGFVRGPATEGFRPLPPGVKIAPTAGVLSALRRSAAGDPVAVLLDGAQSAALPSLAFAADLEVVARSPPLPVGVVATVGRRVGPKSWSRIERALRALDASPRGTAALAGIRMERFEPLDEAALARAREALAPGPR
jgi:hypothetical protein